MWLSQKGDKKKMEIFERIRFLRKNELKYTQEQFADALHITRSSLSVIEIGNVSVTDRNILTICSTFNVNEDWLRLGKEPIFKQLNKEEEIAAYMGTLLSDDGNQFQKRFIRALSKLDDDGWDVIEKLINNMIDNK